MKEQLNPMNCQNETLQKTKLGCGALKPSVCPCETALSLSLSLSILRMQADTQRNLNVQTEITHQTYNIP